jgi:platelet-activating factor acetylhydrolase IB subunit alpha
VQVLRGHEHVIETLSFGKKPITAVDVTKMMTLDASNGNNANNDSELFSYLVSGSRDKSIKLWDPLKGELLMSFNSHANWVRGVVLHPSGKYIISVSDDKSIKVIDIKQGNSLTHSLTHSLSHSLTSSRLVY